MLLVALGCGSRSRWLLRLAFVYAATKWAQEGDVTLT